METTSRYELLVKSPSGRYAVVSVDCRANQVTVPDPDGGRFCRGGTGDQSIAAAADWSARFGQSWATLAGARRALRAAGMRTWIDSDGDTRVDYSDRAEAVQS